MRSYVMLLVCVLLPLTIRAFDQKSLNDSPRYIDVSTLTNKAGTPLVNPADGTIKVENADELLSKLFGAAETLDHPFVVHSIAWKSKGGLQIADGANHWYVYDPSTPSRSSLTEFFMNDGWTQKRFEGDRIFGTKKLTFVYIHQHARGQIDKDRVKAALAEGLKSANHTTDAAASDGALAALQDMLKGKRTDYSFSDASTTKSISLVCSDVLYKGGCVESEYTAVTYDFSVTKKTPQPIAHLQAALETIAGQGAGGAVFAIPMDDITLWQSMDLSDVLNPSTITIAGTVGVAPQATTFSTKSIINEGKYWGDISFAVPLNSYRDISFDDTSSTITPKSVKRENVYVVGDIYWPRIDLQEATKRLVPHLLAGMPIKNSPLNHLMVGAGIGFNYVEPFAAVVFVRSKQAISGVSMPTNSTQLETRVNYKVIWGLNMPVGSIAKFLSKGSGSATGK